MIPKLTQMFRDEFVGVAGVRTVAPGLQPGESRERAEVGARFSAR